MRVVPPETSETPDSPESTRRERRPRRRAWTRPLLLILVSLVFAFVVPMLEYMESYLAYRPWRMERPRNNLVGLARDTGTMALAVPDYYAHRLGMTSGAEVPTVQLDIKFQDFNQISEKRREALAKGVLFTSDDDFVPAVMHADGKAVRIDVRLKGDMVDHLARDRWSLRVKVKRGESVFGMRRFSLQSPHTRGYQADILFNEFLRRHDIITPRMFPVELVVNGKRIGVTIVEEHFARELLESQGRRESVILKFDEANWWRAWVDIVHAAPDFDNWRTTPLIAFRERKHRESETLAPLLETGIGLARGFINGTIPPSEVLDAELWGRHLAAGELWFADHMIGHKNVRFYYNPITCKLEPICFDSDVLLTQIREDLVCVGGARLMTTAMIADLKIRNAMLESLEAMSTEILSDEFGAWLEERDRALLAVLRRDFPTLKPLDVEALRKRARMLQGLTPKAFRALTIPKRTQNWLMSHEPDTPYPAAVYAYLVQGEQGWELEIVNTLSIDVTITDLRYAPESVEAARPLATVLRRALPIDLKPSVRGKMPKRVRLPVPAPETDTWTIEGVARPAGHERSFPFTAEPSFGARARSPIPNSDLESLLRRHPFVHVDREQRDWLVVTSGRWTVSGSLVLPEGLGLRIPLGTTLRFERDAMLVAFGPLEFEGAADRPVVLEPQADSWQGLVVLGTAARSRWRHVVVRNTSGVAHDGWSLTGGVTFRRSDVEIRECTFEGSVAEDALNVIRSTFALTDVTFRDTRSDALDADFCTGTIDGGGFERMGGDGIDVSGSTVEVRDVRIALAHDKAISVGEASRLNATGVRLESNGVGLACKDGSVVVIRDSQFTDCRHVDLMAYCKKPEYGSASLTAEGITRAGAGRRVLVQTGNSLRVDGEPALEEDVDIDALYETGFMRK